VLKIPETVLLWLSGIDKVPWHGILPSPFQDGAAGELRPVIADDATGLAVEPHERIQFSRDTRPRDAGIGDQPQVLSGAIVDHCQNAELARCAEGVRHEVERPPGIDPSCLRHRCPRSTGTLAAPPTLHGQAFLPMAQGAVHVDD